ncbi:MAG: hypothetical protein HDR07_10595 [Lachnospiraceae bacterium]|nr:hypothetical protein [Lachnospiraceae bacterium]
MFMEIISILLGVFLLGVYGYGYEEGWAPAFAALIDCPSLIIILVLIVPVLLRSGVWQDFKRAWKLLKKDYSCHLSELRRTLDVVEMIQKQGIYAGIISMLLSIITVLRRLSDLTSLGPNLAVAVLTMFYAVIFEMLLLPMQLEVKRRIIDYMEEDTDAESETAQMKFEETVAGTEEGQI